MQRKVRLDVLRTQLEGKRKKLPAYSCLTNLKVCRVFTLFALALNEMYELMLPKYIRDYKR